MLVSLKSRVHFLAYRYSLGKLFLLIMLFFLSTDCAQQHKPLFCGNQSLSECLRKAIKAFDFKEHIGLLILFDPHHNVTQNLFRGNKKFVLNIAHYDASSFLQGLSKLWRTGSLSSSRSKLWSPDFSRVSGDPVENALISRLVCRARLWDSLKCFPVLYCTICIKLITCSFFRISISLYKSFHTCY